MSKFFSQEAVQIEAHENFQKQSYRNRCEILSANGTLSLAVPLIKRKDKKTPIKDVIIDYQTNWQKQHFKSIESAYNSSPFYEYIIDDFRFVFDGKEKFLFDLNNKIFEKIEEYLLLKKKINFSSDYIVKLDNDYRNCIHPKAKMQKKDDTFLSINYYQTFNNKFNFIPNLSVLDLLFNEGTLATSILKKSVVNH